MNTNICEPHESLVHLRTTRRGSPVELTVQYEVSSSNGCLTYRIITVEDTD
ncbi:MAG: hypothetical protein M3N54_08675 [Acidobacteriota bacterium]|nr:hypothetical protein [Acidobacteriota bacterium]